MPKRTNDDRALGALVVGALFGAVGAGAMSVGYGFGLAATIGFFALIATIVASVLLLGWRDRLPPAMGPGKAPTVGSAGSAGIGAGAAPTAGGVAEEEAAAPTPEPEPAYEIPVYEGEPERPSAMDAPRDGKPDDLQQIKGVGPALEKLCHSLGFYHYDQIANWTEAEVAWVDQNLEGFKGRVTRDQWVSQAKTLADAKTAAA